MNRIPPSMVLRTALLCVASLLFSGLAQLNAATTDPAKAEFLSPLEKEIAQEINLARTSPSKYATFLEDAKRYYKGLVYQPPSEQALTTQEGVAAVDEAIRELRATPVLGPFDFSQGMSSGASDHFKDMARTGNRGHIGSDGSIPDQRVSRYGLFRGAIGENISYFNSTARKIVMSWIIDDGVGNRGHRRAILNPAYRSVGLSAGPSTKYGTLCVVTFAATFTERPAPSKKQVSTRF